METENTSPIRRTRYFVLKKNNLVEEFFNLEDALNCTDQNFTILDKFKEFFSPHGGYNYRVSEFIFLKSENQPFYLSNNSWTIHAIETTYKSASQIIFDIVISDQSRKIRRLSSNWQQSRKNEDLNSHDIHIVQMSLAKLYEHSKFQSWEQMDLEIENNKLKVKIELLEKKIGILKNKI